jgi:hypothetical protein
MITVVSHDAGGAEILSSFVKQSNSECNFILDGPAINIFKKKLGEISIVPIEAIINSDGVLCGSSWASDLELQAIRFAQSINKTTTVFLDHWVNYRERFTRNGKTLLPDKILVGDHEAEKIAKTVFPDLNVVLTENPYFEDVYREYEILKRNYQHSADESSVLYVCEPISEHALKQYGSESYLGYTECDALNYFLKNINVIINNVNKITIRPHPSEECSKYSWVMDQFNLPICIDKNSILIESIVESEVVVGCESMAMVIGLMAEKKVISSIPKNGRKCVLPHSNIIHLQDLLEQA